MKEVVAEFKRMFGIGLPLKHTTLEITVSHSQGEAKQCVKRGMVQYRLDWG